MLSQKSLLVNSLWKYNTLVKIWDAPGLQDGTDDKDRYLQEISPARTIVVIVILPLRILCV